MEKIINKLYTFFQRDIAIATFILVSASILKHDQLLLATSLLILSSVSLVVVTTSTILEKLLKLKNTTK